MVNICHGTLTKKDGREKIMIKDIKKTDFNRVIINIFNCLISASIGIICCRYDLLVCAMAFLYITIEMFIIALNSYLMEVGIKRSKDHRIVREDIKELTVIMIVSFMIMNLAIIMSNINTEICIITLVISMMLIVLAFYKMIIDKGN